MWTSAWWVMEVVLRNAPTLMVGVCVPATKDSYFTRMDPPAMVRHNSLFLICGTQPDISYLSFADEK